MNVGLSDALASELYRLARGRFAWAACALTAAAGFLGAMAPSVAERAGDLARSIDGGGGGAASAPVNAWVYWSSSLKGVAILAGLFLTLACSGVIAGESASGTLRLSLSRPLRRSHLFFAKFLAVGALLEVLLCLGAGAAFGGAAIAGDFGPVVKYGLTKSTSGSMALRALLALAVSELGLLAILGAALLASVRSSSAATATSVTLVFLVAAGLAAVAVDAARPYLFPAFAISPFDTLRSYALGIDAPRPVWFGKATLQDWADVAFAIGLPASSALLLVSLAARSFVRRDWLA